MIPILSTSSFPRNPMLWSHLWSLTTLVFTLYFQNSSHSTTNMINPTFRNPSGPHVISIYSIPPSLLWLHFQSNPTLETIIITKNITDLYLVTHNGHFDCQTKFNQTDHILLPSQNMLVTNNTTCQIILVFFLPSLFLIFLPSSVFSIQTSNTGFLKATLALT